MLLRPPLSVQGTLVKFLGYNKLYYLDQIAENLMRVFYKQVIFNRFTFKYPANFLYISFKHKLEIKRPCVFKF